MVTAPDVVVAGAGVIGLSTALHLATAGASVEVVDAAGPGAGASRTNAGWVVPSMSEPVPSPAAIRTARHWALRGDGPFNVGFEPSPHYLAFLARMLLSCRPATYERGLNAMARLALGAVNAFDDLRRRGVNFEWHADGVLMLFLSASSLEAHQDDLKTMARLGLPAAKALNAREVREIEPAIGPNVVGGFLTAGDQHVDPSSLVDGLVDACRRLGVRFRTGATVTDIVEHGHHIELTASDQVIRTSHLVIAAGVGTRHLARLLGASVPVRAGKGYGFDFRLTTIRLSRPLYLSDHKVAVTPLSSGTRLAGTMELGAENTVIDHRRAGAVARAMRAYVPSWPSATPLPWMGLRPMAPDGLPLIGRLPGSHSVFVATGHAMLGITLGPVTGDLLARLILHGEKPSLLTPFDPARFVRHRVG